MFPLDSDTWFTVVNVSVCHLFLSSESLVRLFWMKWSSSSDSGILFSDWRSFSKDLTWREEKRACQIRALFSVFSAGVDVIYLQVISFFIRHQHHECDPSLSAVLQKSLLWLWHKWRIFIVITTEKHTHLTELIRADQGSLVSCCQKLTISRNLFCPRSTLEFNDCGLELNIIKIMTCGSVREESLWRIQSVNNTGFFIYFGWHLFPCLFRKY